MYRLRAMIMLLAVAVFLLTASASLPLASAHLAVNSAFKLPVPPGVQVTVTQGNNMPAPDWDHNGLSAYAFDFAVGTSNFVITAAQGGKVIGVDDSSTIQCDSLNHQVGTPPTAQLPGCWTKANYVLIEDDDGTAALYLHLAANSAKVKIGYTVKQSQQLGLADTTGWASGPHLHFQAEQMPSQAAQQAKNPGWWFTQSVPVSFSNPEVLAKRPDGVPLTYDSFCLGAKTCSSSPPPAILPGGMWADPSPKDGQTVQDVIHFAAHAYPTNSGDPAIAQVNFTVGSQGAWKVACTAIPPQSGDLFACDANLKDLGVSYGQIQVSFDVYDQAGNVNLAPNGVHTLTYASPPQLVAKPTYFRICSTQNPSCTYSDCTPHRIDDYGSGQTCTVVLSSPGSNQSSINWSATPGGPANDAGMVFFGYYLGSSFTTSASGVLDPGQQTTLYIDIVDSAPCLSATVTITGGIQPVVVQMVCS